MIDAYLSFVAAAQASLNSPCQSKRGVCIWNPETGERIATGFNRQPDPFICDGSDRCKRDCGKTAIHAEQDALIRAGEKARLAYLIHVKTENGAPVASGAPSCLECSKLMLFAGIARVFLVQRPIAQKMESRDEGHIPLHGDLVIRSWSAEQFHLVTAWGTHSIALVGWSSEVALATRHPQEG